ncbi:hypothetical protein C3L33_00715, partial [Rhododendron williamsianum]
MQSRQHQLDEAGTYIKLLEKRVEELKARRVALAMGNHDGTDNDGNTSIRIELPVVELRECLRSGLEVVLITGLKKNFAISEAIGVIEDEGAEVVSASFSTVGDMVFHTLHAQVKVCRVGVDTAKERVLVYALSECERNPSIGKTKRCVGSIEDMIDFAVSVLGHNATVRATENINGSNQNVMIGKVKGINDGEVTKLVSCHESLYPYLLYYCHSVPKVRVYMSDIVDVERKVKINEGAAICHIDRSTWSPGYKAFMALGSSPGLIEVCP